MLQNPHYECDFLCRLHLFTCARLKLGVYTLKALRETGLRCGIYPKDSCHKIARDRSVAEFQRNLCLALTSETVYHKDARTRVPLDLHSWSELLENIFAL